MTSIRSTAILYYPVPGKVVFGTSLIIRIVTHIAHAHQIVVLFHVGAARIWTTPQYGEYAVGPLRGHMATVYLIRLLAAVGHFIIPIGQYAWSCVITCVKYAWHEKIHWSGSTVYSLHLRKLSVTNILHTTLLFLQAQIFLENYSCLPVFVC